MTLTELVSFLKRHQHAVEATVGPDGAPEAAVVGIAVDEDGSVYFDTVKTSRKLHNLERNPRIALVVWSGEQTVQLEGIADQPQGRELERLKHVYFSVFPDGAERERWPDITWVRVRPRWARFSDFTGIGKVEVLQF